MVEKDTSGYMYIMPMVTSAPCTVRLTPQIATCRSPLQIATLWIATVDSNFVDRHHR